MTVRLMDSVIRGTVLSKLVYIVPARPHKYPTPVPGHVKGTKKEWVPCPVCTRLVLRRLNHKQKRTCSSKCSITWSRIHGKYLARMRMRKTNKMWRPYRTGSYGKDWSMIRFREKDRSLKRKKRYRDKIQELWGDKN